VIIADKGYVSRELHSHLTDRGVRLLRPSYRHPTPHPAPASAQASPPTHRIGEPHIDGVTARIVQRLLAMTTAIWHNRARSSSD
jgi:hypothetical protein